MDRLGKGAEILFCYRPPERLTVPVAGTMHQPLRSRTLCEVLFDLYLGAEALSEQGRRSVIASFPRCSQMHTTPEKRHSMAKDVPRCALRRTDGA